MKVELEMEEIFCGSIGIVSQWTLEGRIYDVPDRLVTKWMKVREQFEKSAEEIEKFMEENEAIG